MSSVDNANTIATDATSLSSDLRSEAALPEFTRAMAETVQSIANGLQALDGALLPILHAVQKEFRYIHKQAVPIIAECLNLSRADVHGVLTFYHDFKQQPPAETMIKICRAEACQAQGAERLFEEATEQFKQQCHTHSTNAVPALGIESVYCLGNCACGPAVMIENALYGRVDSQRLRQLVDQLPADSSEQLS